MHDWHPEDVKAAIRKTGITLTGLAIEAGYNGAAVRAALRLPWPQIEAIIARRLGTAPWVIWPSRYDSFGNPLRAPGHKNRSPRGAKNHQQKENAA
jgi:Ner family transcriptional regulator